MSKSRRQGPHTSFSKLKAQKQGGSSNLHPAFDNFQNDKLIQRRIYLLSMFWTLCLSRPETARQVVNTTPLRLSTMSINPIIILPYQKAWAREFEVIKAELAGDFTDFGCNFISIEHVVSTSVPGQAAKPVIDIHIIIPAEDFNDQNRERFQEAMFNGDRRGDYHLMGDGGVGGRWSFKIHFETRSQPWRNVSVVAQGSLVSRTSLPVRDTLRKDPQLREKYGKVKKELAKETYHHVTAYSLRKNAIIREILKKAGWSEGDIKAKEDNITVVYPEIQWAGRGF